MKTIINTTNAPAPIGPYSQAVAVNGLLFISGQIPMNPATGEIVTTGITDEAKMVMENLKAILTEAGSSFDTVIKSTIFLTDMQTFAQVNEVYGSYFTTDFPARETVQVSALPKGVNVEISVIALKD
ncbi:reactive intermediate/imine deaminase [Mucilaginibacter sp. MD40]|uniref:RidA family protein n=1 Tax=Mucilaginibacter sp. MD40 TaxID=2029590 RepID=UPI000BAC55CE|nr:RidA family protein [Mucilaginibacter sp. MD40]PAW93068.1 reactive intermediate/imine deaminase [Mucilaginibacter sp. MD40]